MHIIHKHDFYHDHGVDFDPQMENLVVARWGLPFPPSLRFGFVEHSRCLDLYKILVVLVLVENKTN